MRYIDYFLRSSEDTFLIPYGSYMSRLTALPSYAGNDAVIGISMSCIV